MYATPRLGDHVGGTGALCAQAGQGSGMRRSRAVGAATAVLFAAALASPAHANHSWANYHWARTANPFTLALGDNVSSAWDGYLGTSSVEWTASAALDTTVQSGGTTPRKCRATAGRVEVCSAAYGRNGWLGVASIWVSGSHITSGTVKVNDTYFAMARYNTPDERAHVMCQEIGHTLGLGHTSENGTSQKTCMDYSTDPESTGPNAHDYEQLETIYAHLDSTTTVGSLAGAQTRQIGGDRSSWGREVHRSAKGEYSTFVRDFGRGNQVITEVTWARQPDGRPDQT
jgi:hypothetical protein